MSGWLIAFFILWAILSLVAGLALHSLNKGSWEFKSRKKKIVDGFWMSCLVICPFIGVPFILYTLFHIFRGA